MNVAELGTAVQGLWNSGMAWGLLGVGLGLVVGIVVGNRQGEKRTLAHLRAWRVVERLPVPPLTVRSPLHRDHPATGMACYHDDYTEGSAGE